MFSARSIQVLLNVYDLVEQNQYLYSMGIGAYHSGVEILETEYSFGRLDIEGATGVFECPPKSVLPLRETILMGEIHTTPQEIEEIINELKPQFLGQSYNPLKKNCNHFSEALCVRLLNKSIPSYVNRLSYFGSYVQCLLPPEFQDNVEEQIPGPIRFPGPAAPVKSDRANIPISSADDIATRRERCAKAAMKRLQQ